MRGANGAVRMVKVNIDESQQVAAQLRVQSIPAVFAFQNGQPVDGFMGALPGSEIKAFVAKLAELGGGGNGLGEALDQADQMLEAGAAADAVQVFAAVMAEEPGNARAIGGLARAHLATGNVDQAREVLALAPPEIAGDPAISAARSALDLAEQTQDTGEAAELAAKLDANADDHQARYDLALALLANGDREGAPSRRSWSSSAATGNGMMARPRNSSSSCSRVLVRTTR